MVFKFCIQRIFNNDLLPHFSVIHQSMNTAQHRLMIIEHIQLVGKRHVIIITHRENQFSFDIALPCQYDTDIHHKWNPYQDNHFPYCSNA